MTTVLSLVPAAPVAPVSAPAAVQADARPAVLPAPTEPALRLVIEEHGETSSFVYKMLDSMTGEVISQMPREEVLRIRDQPDYEAGDVADTLI